MAFAGSDTRLRLVTWNLERSSVSRFREQLASLQQQRPDIIALQEVGVKASRQPRRLLREHGYEYTAHSHDFLIGDTGNSSGVAFASRWPFRVLSPETFEMPAQHHALSAEFFTPFGRIEGHTVHVLPGSMDRQRKTEMFEGIYDRLAQEERPDYRFLCGDFNAPKEESEDGQVTVWGNDDRSKSAERKVVVGLAEYELRDAYRSVNGYGNDEFSWVAKNGDDEWPRRFDHVFASEQLNAVQATYLHEYDHLSDHTPLEVVFLPTNGRETASKPSEHEPSPITAETEGASVSVRSPSLLVYEDDVRQVNPEANYRQGRFKAGWNSAVAGQEMSEDTLRKLTWENLGWRLGMLFQETSENLQEAHYDWCVKQQVE